MALMLRGRILGTSVIWAFVRKGVVLLNFRDDDTGKNHDDDENYRVRSDDQRATRMVSARRP